MIKTNALVAAGLLFTATVAFADVHINEVDADQTSTDSAEFVELYDGGVGNTDLTGLVLVLMNGSDDASYLAFDLDGMSTNGQGYFVLCGDAANVPNCDLDVSPDTNLIQNGADAVALYTGDASDFPNDTPVTTTNLLDAIVYDTNDDDDPGLLVLLNADQPQVNECGGGGCTTDSNQRCPNGSGGGRNTDTYVQAIPTPGAENSCADAFGACCDDSTGDCTEDVAEASCNAAGKRYGGDGSDCSTIDPPCLPPPAGACCDDSTGECTDDVTQDDCDAAGNRYGGDGSDCGTIDPPCVPPPTGACCSAGFCGDDVSQDGCETGGGTYQGDGSQCPQDCGPESTVIINEIRIDHPGADINEYFELAGGANESLAGLTYIVIGDGSGGSGTIEAVINLSGNSIPADGLFVGAEDTFTLGTPDLVTNLNFENSDNVTHLLVGGFTGANGDDLDLDDDGVLDIEPWAVIVSCVALVETPDEGDQIYCDATVGPDGFFVPGHAYFCEAANQWLIGGFDVGSNDTPGAENPSCTVQCTGGGAAPAIEINEIRVKQAGLDIDEYFELAGDAFTSLEGVAYLVIGDSAEQGSGVVEAIVCLNGQFILGDGFFVVAEDTFSLGDGVADLELPGGELNFVDADPRTHMIVLNFNGVVGQDLDIDDDGVLDIDPPWDEIIADVALRGPDEPCTGGVPCIYSDFVVGPDVVPEGVFSPGHVYRCDTALTWTVGAFDTQPGQPECAQDTPGGLNESCDFISPCGCSAAGSCFVANGSANCNDAACCDLIISGFDATCADDWDQACADLALIECSSCGAPNAGNCLVANGTPYCTESACCDLICGDGGLDPSCCELPNGWDAACAALADAQCDIPPPVQPGDLVLGLSADDGLLTLELIRGDAVANGGGLTADSWEESLIQSVEFDNLNGIQHNDRGNLLGLTFGTSSATGGTIHSFATCIATSAGQFIGDTQGTGGEGLTTTRLGGLSVSPDNTKIAVAGGDTGQVIVYDYTAGDCAGAGASLSGARQTADGLLCSGDTQGTAWLDNNTVLAFSTTGELFAVDVNSMAATLLTTVDTVIGCGPGYSDIEYNPEISPNVYVMYSAFSGGTLNLLFVLDPTDEFNLLGTWDYSTSIETTREIAFDAFGNLFVGQYGGSQTCGQCDDGSLCDCPEEAAPDCAAGPCIGAGPPIDIILDAVNLASLADNNSFDWYTSSTKASFSGIDVAIGSLCGACVWDTFPVDGVVGAGDLAFLLGSWGLIPQDADPAVVCLDIDGNGSIGALDLANLLGNWGPC